MTDQDVYLKALRNYDAVDVIEYGTYVTRIAFAPLATIDKKNRPVIARRAWPLRIQNGSGEYVDDGKFMVSIAKREEKGSDVNVASHLMRDAFTGQIDAAIVISNDSDLRLPVQEVRRVIPLGLVNPTGKLIAGDLRGAPTDGVGNHWWYSLKKEDFIESQLPSKIGTITIPIDW